MLKITLFKGEISGILEKFRNFHLNVDSGAPLPTICFVMELTLASYLDCSVRVNLYLILGPCLAYKVLCNFHKLFCTQIRFSK